MVVVVDYGMGNIGSIENMLLKVGAKNVKVTSRPEEILLADRLIIPGVGNFGRGANQLDKLQLREALTEVAVNKGAPVLGVCLGMQLMVGRSEEGEGEGLGWFDAEVKKIPASFQGKSLRVPHMGWNFVDPKEVDPLFDGLDKHSRFYHVHSYHVVPENEDDVCCRTSYGVDMVTAIGKKNIYGVQFHPEKSHMYGKILFGNFLKI